MAERENNVYIVFYRNSSTKKMKHYMVTNRLIAIAIIVFLLLDYKLANVEGSPLCKWDQITRMDVNSTPTCWDCPDCVKGAGLEPQCASYVSNNVPIRCVPCQGGISFSDVHDISSCKPCSICGENEVTLRSCNATHNAICGRCKPGFYRAITEDCWPCTKCCPDSTLDELQPQCLSQGLPAERSCRLDVKTDACAHAPTFQIDGDTVPTGYGDTVPTGQSDTAPTGHSSTGRQNATRIVVYDVTFTASLRSPIVLGVDGIWTGIGIGIGLCVVIAIFYVISKRCRSNSRSSVTFRCVISPGKSSVEALQLMAV